MHVVTDNSTVSRIAKCRTDANKPSLRTDVRFHIRSDVALLRVWQTARLHVAHLGSRWWHCVRKVVFPVSFIELACDTAEDVVATDVGLPKSICRHSADDSAAFVEARGPRRAQNAHVGYTTSSSRYSSRHAATCGVVDEDVKVGAGGTSATLTGHHMVPCSQGEEGCSCHTAHFCLSGPATPDFLVQPPHTCTTGSVRRRRPTTRRRFCRFVNSAK